MWGRPTSREGGVQGQRRDAEYFNGLLREKSGHPSAPRKLGGVVDQRRHHLYRSSDIPSAHASYPVLKSYGTSLYAKANLATTSSPYDSTRDTSLTITEVSRRTHNYAHNGMVLAF